MRAGLELVVAITALKSSVPIQTRIGIATGLVVVGDLIGSGSAQEQAIVGETPNLAARLQGVAEPNSVVIAESTRKLVGNLFDLEDLGAKDLKGIAGPVRAWAALRTSSAEGRFEAFHASGLADVVGREEETELLLRRWSKAKSGEGQVALLSGEAGIGKSRLTAALLEGEFIGTKRGAIFHDCWDAKLQLACLPLSSEKAHSLRRRAESGQASSSDKRDPGIAAMLRALPNTG